ncbi:MAG: hypothetical protein M1825_006304 [Sarcosagium campestre]|nr:MAG: hypothetical protein M1825_006304 [Sarcosagium campestre]
MSFILRPKLVCFYCGCRSAQVQNGKVRSWKCTECEAVNYLDEVRMTASTALAMNLVENGEVTDPPLESVTTANNNCTIGRATSISAANRNQDLFCAACLKNQHLLTENLSEYLPPPDHAEYEAYVSSYPAFRRSLEERYPQICVDCEPRARARIKAAGYVAKTDHLRRLVEKTRGSSSEVLWTGASWSFRGVLVGLGGLGWATSIIGQLIWSTSALVSREGSDDARGYSASLDPAECVRQLVTLKAVDAECSSSMTTVAGWALIAGLMSIWWNNKQAQKVRGLKGRLVGLSDYYKLQILVLSARSVAWFVLKDSDAFGLDVKAVQGIHIFLLAFVAITTATSLRTVRIDNTPLVRFHDSDESLLAHPDSKQIQESTASRLNVPATTPAYFPVDRLVTPRPAEVTQRLDEPLTPPPETGDSDQMDWTPTQQSFHPAQRPTYEPAFVPSFSTFQRLPPAPKSQAAKLRNPPNTVPYFKTSEKKQRNFFKEMTNRTTGQPGQGLDTKAPQGRAEDDVFAPPRFFPMSDFADTGLEGLFDAAFSMKDEPREVRVARAKQSVANARRQHRWSPTSMLSSIVLSATLYVWKQITPTSSPYLRVGLMVIASVIASRRLAVNAQPTIQRRNYVDVALLIIEVVTAVGTLACLLLRRGNADLLDLLGTVLLAEMAIQEAWLSVYSPALGQSDQAPAPESIATPNADPVSHDGPVDTTRTPAAAPNTAPSTASTAESLKTPMHQRAAGRAPPTSLFGINLGGTDDPSRPPSPSSVSTAYSVSDVGFNGRRRDFVGRWD